MILQALTKYYDILANDLDSGIPLQGYCTANVSFALNLSHAGELLDVFPQFDQMQFGKKTKEVPRRIIVPEHIKRSSGISANFLCDNCSYVLGLTSKDARDAEYARKRFEAFCQFNIDLLTKTDSPAAHAVIAFLASHDPAQAQENLILAKYLAEILNGGNLVFMLDGDTGFVHDYPEIRRVWEEYKMGSTGVFISQCLVTGELAPIERLHPSLKGIKDANPTGATLVGFNARAYESFNRNGEQGLNSPVGQKAAFAYTTALNYLLAPRKENRKITIGDTTVAYWAESKDRIYETAFAQLFEPGQEEKQVEEESEIDHKDPRAEHLLQAIAKKVNRAEAVDQEGLSEELNWNTQFYVLGLAPNAARVSIRFFQKDPFLKIIQKIMIHYADMQIEKEFDDQPEWISVRRILDETVSKKSTEKNPSPLMAGAVFRAILNQTPYPAALYYAIINRIRADTDDSSKGIKKINYFRAAIIKAFLIRKYSNKDQTHISEVLCMSLNEKSTNQAYLLGRLFAVLEKAQQDAALPSKLNATIKDRYFTSACAAPATVFPVLLRLSQHHISKAEYGYVSDNRIGEIMNLLDVTNNPIPAHLMLDDQGIFILGYYHQRVAFYKPKEAIENIPSQPSLI